MYNKQNADVAAKIILRPVVLKLTMTESPWGSFLLCVFLSEVIGTTFYIKEIF